MNELHSKFHGKIHHKATLEGPLSMHLNVIGTVGPTQSCAVLPRLTLRSPVKLRCPEPTMKVLMTAANLAKSKIESPYFCEWEGLQCPGTSLLHPLSRNKFCS